MGRLAKVKPSNKEQYINWLSECVNSGKLNNLCKAYEKIDKYCLKKNIIQDSLLWYTDVKTVVRVKNVIERSRVFKFFHRRSIEELEEAIELFYLYTKNNEGFKKQSKESNADYLKKNNKQKYMVRREKSYKEKIKKYRKILIENFSRNFRYDSRLELKKFKAFWREEFSEELTDSDWEIQNNISRITILYSEGERKFALIPETILSEKNKQNLLAYIDSLFKSGKNAIYYNALYEETLDFLYDSKVNNADILKEYLKYIDEEGMIFKNWYFSMENIEIDPMLEVKDYLINKAKPINQEVICNNLSHIPRKKIIGILHNNKEFIRNSTGVYFHPDSIIIDDKEINGISQIIGNEIERNGFITEKELIKFLKSKFPQISEKYYQLTDLGLRDFIGYKLKDEYSFNSKIISRKWEKLSVRDIFEKFCEKNKKITLMELKMLKKDLNTAIYFDVIYNQKLRINEEEFVCKELANFDVDKIDNVIDEYCYDEYISIQAIRYFFSFPECRFKWNSYLLEHYIAEYSKKYKLVHINFNENSCVGAIVKVSSKIETFYDLVVRVLVDSNIILDTSTALDYLYDQGYLGRRSYKNIDKALIQAKAMKEKRG